MPQMAPLLWLPLMMTFSLLLVTTMIMMFFYSPIFLEHLNKKLPSTQANISTMVNSSSTWPW